jgi:hypothetical protein
MNEHKSADEIEGEIYSAIEMHDYRGFIWMTTRDKLTEDRSAVCLSY